MYCKKCGKLIKISFLKMVLLSCVTCGIYSIYAFCKFTKNVNILCEGDGRESYNYFVVILLGILTCGIYTFYWIYQQAQRMYDIAPKYKCRINITGTKMLLWDTFGNLIIIGPLVVWYYMLKNMNQLVEQFNHGVIDESYQLPNNKKNIKKPVAIIAVYYLLLIACILSFTLLSLGFSDVEVDRGEYFESDIVTESLDKDNDLNVYLKNIIGLVINPGTVKPVDIAENILENIKDIRR